MPLNYLVLVVAVLSFSVSINGYPSAGTAYYDDDDSDVVEVSLNSIDKADSINMDIIDLSHFGNAIYGSPNETTADLIANYSPEDSLVNPEELGSYLEGDILIPRESNVITKNGVTTQSSRWPNGIVPYEIRGNFNGRDMATIQHAIDEYHRRTCIRFIPKTNQQDYVSIVSGNSGCWSSVGRVGGRQEVNLQSPGCLGKPGTAMHELMHALGFLHEQNREERDNYVAIQYQNIQPSATSNFERAAHTMAFGVPYDYSSVMHYSANAFSSNGRPTIVAMQPGASTKMGQRDGFTEMDVEKLNKMYDCGYGQGAVPAPIGQPGMIAGPGPIAGPGVIAGPGPIPGEVPAPLPGPIPPTAVGGNNIIGSFLGGLISGLGLAEEETTVASSS